MNYETAAEIELAIARYFWIRSLLIVPNVRYGFFVDGRECDIVILNKSGFAYEVEIKISKSDLKKDQMKWHNHRHKNLKKLWFAIPEKLNTDKVIPLVPKYAGILVISAQGMIKELIKPEINNDAIKLTALQQFTLARLGALRIWDLKRNIARLYLEKGKSEDSI